MKLAGFPAHLQPADGKLYRLHRVEHTAWWFSADGSGRFDPVGTQYGACYLAERWPTPWIEVFRKRMLVAEAEVRARRLFAVALGRDARLADLTSRRALAYGVTASLGADQHYRPSQDFAAHAVGAGFDGVRYFLRHDPAQQLIGVALFGPVGVPAADDERWPVGRDTDLSPELVANACATFGYRVLPTP